MPINAQAARRPKPINQIHDETSRAELRRDAFRAFMRQHALTVQQWADQAGLPNTSALTNFLAGLSKSLNIATLEKLAEAADVPISDILGDSRPIQVNGGLHVHLVISPDGEATQAKGGRGATGRR